jgi:transposase
LEEKMAQTRYTEEFKREAVKLALTSGLPRQAMADDLGVGKSTLGKWISLYRREQQSLHAGGLPLDELQKELIRLTRENKILREERDLLKKATAFFASQK